MAIDKILPAAKKDLFIFMVMGAIGLICFSAIFIVPGYGDETNYHFPLARNFSLKQILDPASNYSSAYAPLPYLIGNILYRIFPSLSVLRILNFIVFILMIRVFYLLIEKTSRDPLLITLLVFLNPYFLMSSFVYYMYNWGPLFALSGLYFYLIKGSRILSGFFLALAVLSQQWMLVFVLAIVLHETIQFLERKMNPVRLFKNVLAVGSFFAPAVYLFIRWHGLVHPNFSSHTLHPSFEHLNAVVAHVGLIMLFPVLANFRSFFNKKNIWLLFLLPLFWLSVPTYNAASGMRHIAGYFPYSAVVINTYVKIPYKLTLFIFIIPGLLFLKLMLKKNEADEFKVISYSIFIFFAALTASVRLATAHIYICIPFLLLLFDTEIVRLKKMKILMVCQYLFICLFYIFYFTFIRSQASFF